MNYYVSCAECELEQQVEDLETVFELEDRHHERYDDRHVLEFEKQ